MEESIIIKKFGNFSSIRKEFGKILIGELRKLSKSSKCHYCGSPDLERIIHNTYICERCRHVQISLTLKKNPKSWRIA